MEQNPYLCESASCNQQTGDQKKKKKNNTVIPIIASIAGILVLLVITAAAIICGLKKRKTQGKAVFTVNYHLKSLVNYTRYDLIIICKQLKKISTKLAAVSSHVEFNTPNGSQLESKQRQYTYSDLAMITNSFDRILGRGGFGTVYHGLIDDIQVAVKMLSASSVQGYQQFLAEASDHYF